MSVGRIEVNGHELTAFDLPPEPSETYTVNVDGLGEVVVEKGKPPKEKDVPAMYMRKLVPELCEQNAELYRENAKLREQMERLVTLLRADCDIEASWDGLRKFWSIGLTENGCLMRDRACKAEAENAKLRERCRYLMKGDILHVLTDQEYIDQCERERLMQVSIDALDKENAKLRELVRIMHSEMVSCEDNGYICGGHKFDKRVSELGIEVGA